MCLNDTVRFEDLRIKIFSDGADLDKINAAYEEGVVKGFTTNPTLMEQAGITNYMAFAKEVIKIVPDLPVSFEVFSDEFEGMHKQALRLKALGENVYVKIPVTNTKRESATPLIKSLSNNGVKLNITAILSLRQVQEVYESLNADVPSIVSVFAGRIADSGIDPIPLMQKSLDLLKPNPNAELLWASPREILNLVQADQIGCHIITITPDILAKRMNLGKDLEDFSLDTVKMFYDAAVKSGFDIPEE